MNKNKNLEEKLAYEKSRRKMEKLEEKRKSVENILEENAEFDRLRPRFKVPINSEMAEWKRFQKLPKSEKEAEIARNSEEIRSYLLTREKFVEDFKKRFGIDLEKSDVEDSDSDDKNEKSESEFSESEDSEDVSDEEEETEDWREIWLKQTGEPWPNYADQIWGPAKNHLENPKLTIVEAAKMLKMPKKKEGKMGEIRDLDEKMGKSNLIDQTPSQDFHHLPFFESHKSTVTDEKLFESLASDSDLSMSSDDSADSSFQANAFNDFFASRPQTPINRETPEKLLPDFDLLQRFPTPEILDSRILKAPRIETSRGKAPPTSSKSTWNPKKSTRIAEKRAKSQISTAKTTSMAKRAKSTVERREMPRRGARERDIQYFQAGEEKKERKIPDPKSETIRRTVKKRHP